MMKNEWIERLVNLQTVDLRMRELSLKLSMIPKEKNLLKEKATQNLDDINTQKLAIQTLEMNVKKNESKINALDEQIQKLKQQSALVKKNNEYQAMLTTIADTQKKISDLDDQSLIIMDDIQKKKVELNKNTANMKLLNTSLKAEFKELDDLEKSLTGEIKRLTDERNIKATRVDSSILSRYNALLSKGNGKPLSMILGDNCENCHLKVTAHTISNAKKGMVVYCDNCQHFLFLEENLNL